MSRMENRKKKKRKKLGFTIAVLVSVLAIGTYYWIDQYNKGKSLNDERSLVNEEHALFDGPEPQFGEINILLLGSDARAEEEGRSDTLMIANYNQSTKKVKLVSIMRDTYVDIPNHGMQKMNAAFSLGGPELVRQTVKSNFGIDAHYYAIVDFNGFPKIVDILAPDGIEVDIPYTMSHGIYMTLPKGVQTLHGEQLLGYVRFRHDRLSDFGRVARQQEVLSKLKEEAVSVHSMMSLPKLLGATDAFVDTNLDKMKMLSIGKGILENKSEHVETLRIPIDNSYVDKRVHVGEVLAIDFEKNRQALADFLKGEPEQEAQQ